MRVGLVTLVGLFLLVCNASAQDRAELAKYEMIRETIDFLATDKAVSRDTNFRISCEPLDYECFGRELSGQPIAGIVPWYDRWRAMTVSDSTGLAALKNRLFADILERPGKGYRKQLAGYAGYISRVEGLIDRYVRGATILETEANADADTTRIPATDLAGPSVGADPTGRVITEHDNPKKENTMIAYFALAIGIIALIAAALTIFRSRQPRQVPVESQRLSQQLDELALRLERLERQVADSQSKEAVAHLIEIMEAIEKRVVAQEERDR